MNASLPSQFLCTTLLVVGVRASLELSSLPKRGSKFPTGHRRLGMAGSTGHKMMEGEGPSSSPFSSSHAQSQGTQMGSWDICEREL